MTAPDLTAEPLPSASYEERALQIRADFSTWTANRGMFETLALFAQVRLIISSEMDSLAAIKHSDTIYLYLHSYVAEHYENNKEPCFFLLMHELRHLTQSKFVRDWSHLVNFAPLWQSLTESIPKSMLLQAGITSLDSDFDLKHDIFNIAADAAIHEDLVTLFRPEILEDIATLMQAQDMAKTGEASHHSGLVTVPYVEKIAGRPLERSKDWLYYAKEIVVSLSSRIRREPDLARLLLSRQILRKIHEKYYADQGLDDGALSAVDLILGRAKGESKKILEAQIAQSHQFAGMQALDYEEVYQARSDLNQAIKKILQNVQSAIKIHQKPKQTERRTYTHPHKFLPEAPGLKRQTLRLPHSEAVLVLDTSGSMWIPELLEQMAALTYQLKKRELLTCAYCCDVALHPLEISFGGYVKMKGSGGTVWTRDHHTKILDDLKTTKKIDIYYCTDEDVYGLEDALRDDRVNLVVVNIPNLIHEGLYEKAKMP
jgi:hypothetical protein